MYFYTLPHTDTLIRCVNACVLCVRPHVHNHYRVISKNFKTFSMSEVTTLIQSTPGLHNFDYLVVKIHSHAIHMWHTHMHMLLLVVA